MRFRWKLALLLLGVAVVPLVLLRLAGLSSTKRMTHDFASRVEGEFLTRAGTRMTLVAESYATMEDLGRLWVSSALAGQAEALRRSLAGPDPGGAIPLIHEPGADLAGSTFGKAGQPVFYALGGSSPKDIAGEAVRVAGAWPALAPSLAAMNRAEVGITCYVVLESGLCAVAGERGLPRGYDPRRSSWYGAARSGTSQAWSRPFTDPVTETASLAASMPLRGARGRFAGAVALVFPASAMVRQSELVRRALPGGHMFFVEIGRNPGPDRNSELLILARGGQGDPFMPSRDREVLASGDRKGLGEMVAAMKPGQSGTARLPLDGLDTLWAWGTADGEVALVLTAPYGEVVAPAREGVSFIRDRVGRSNMETAAALAGAALAALFLALWFSRTVTRPISRLSRSARRLAEGDFSVRCDVTSGDELGDLARLFNEAVPRLEEYSRMSQALALAQEVQKRLLPGSAPSTPGLDAAGASLSSDETGGDYYDFPELGQDYEGHVGVAVGDVSGHGVSAALLMATARAFLLQRLAMPGPLEQAVSDVNDRLGKDVGTSGRFMTLFCMALDPVTRQAEFVCAGHDPALVLDPALDEFFELPGVGLPLGVVDGSRYAAIRRKLPPGAVVAIGTDGIWEARNPEGEMFGRSRFMDVLRESSHLGAADMVASVLSALGDFKGPGRFRDDVTLVVLKLADGN